MTMLYWKFDTCLLLVRSCVAFQLSTCSYPLKCNRLAFLRHCHILIPTKWQRAQFIPIRISTDRSYLSYQVYASLTGVASDHKRCFLRDQTTSGPFEEQLRGRSVRCSIPRIGHTSTGNKCASIRKRCGKKCRMQS